MFGRSAQWVTEAGLRRFESVGPRRAAAGRYAPETAECRGTVLGRFFFVQQARATRNEETLRTFEFLHATSGEYLVARLTWRVLLDLVEAELWPAQTKVDR
jgi:hypothetical protein